MPTSAGGTGKTTAQMQDINTFINAGWDFSTPVWEMPCVSTIYYPQLARQQVNFILGDFVDSYGVDLADFGFFADFWIGPYQSELPDANMVAHWKLDEISPSTTAADSVGGHTGTLSGDPCWVTGIKNGALDLDGSDDYVQVADDDVFDFASDADFTIAFWFKPALTINSGTDEHFIGHNDGSDGFYIGFHGADAGKISFGTHNGRVTTTQSSWTAGQWYHIASVISGSGDDKMYVGNVLDNTGESGYAGPPVAGEPLMLGRRSTIGSSNYFGGVIDDVRIYDLALSEGEITGDSTGRRADLNCDGFIDLVDLAAFTDNFPVSPEDMPVPIVPPGPWAKFLEFDLDTDPCWIHDAKWAFGQPTGGGGANGNPDPSSGYTGNNVYGVNLSGDYDTAEDGTHYLTTMAMDCRGYSQVKLKFARWLNCGQYAHHEIEVSKNGSSWDSIWGSSSTADSSWQILEYDISYPAAGQETVYIRWSYNNWVNSCCPPPPVLPYSGWNIDDVQLWGR